MNNIKIDLDQTELGQAENEIFTEEVSDEALEAAAYTLGSITFTSSIDIFACRFC
jgi:hypothetical protein